MFNGIISNKQQRPLATAIAAAASAVAAARRFLVCVNHIFIIARYRRFVFALQSITGIIVVEGIVCSRCQRAGTTPRVAHHTPNINFVMSFFFSSLVEML